ncbi:uncharacterized protein LOC135078059 [Ostrinia nubilalis]|uniref:uncharacterized protein LOC135078059 n=1 Tax=Ostrinia nubilalis TaxID=29057 RepID=UPI003082613D
MGIRYKDHYCAPRPEGADEGEGEGEDDSDDEPERAPPPIVISEADFREKDIRIFSARGGGVGVEAKRAPPPIVISEADFREKGSLLCAADGEGPDEGEGEGEDDSDDEPERAPPPIVISEADFREKVREKRVGILKPQGSLERAREERAMASTQDDPESDGAEDISKSEDKKDLRKPRVNIAMAAIMRKQEESNKQVKFVTPPPTPDTTGDSTEAKDQDKPKVIQPKAIKNLANLPLGRKTGGILSLKDKSAGYPHLQNTDPEPPKKDKEDKKEPKPNQGSSQNSQQSYQPKRQDMPPPNWSPNMPPPNIPYDGPRVNFQKNYGIQNAGISYNPNYPSPPNVNNQGIRLPVVNPKEIDVRTAALQKQNSRQELFQDGHKFGNYSYHVSGDKKNFLNDLPPRFANQYRNWQAAQDSQFNDNKFRDDSFKPNALFNSQQPNWANPPPENYPTQPMPWWKPENPPPNFSNSPSYSPAMGMQPNFYSPHVAPNLPNYQNMPSFNQMQNQSVGQQKPENVPNYLPSTIGQPQLQTLQNMVSSPNFNSSLNNFGSYAPTVGYDSAMYPQFNNNKVGYQPMQMKMMDKPSMEYQANKNLMDIGGLGFGSTAMDMQQRNLGIKFPDNMTSDNGAKNMDPIAVSITSIY